MIIHEEYKIKSKNLVFGKASNCYGECLFLYNEHKEEVLINDYNYHDYFIALGHYMMIEEMVTKLNEEE